MALSFGAGKPRRLMREWIALDPIIVAGPRLVAGWGTCKVDKRVADLVR